MDFGIDAITEPAFDDKITELLMMRFTGGNDLVNGRAKCMEFCRNGSASNLVMIRVRKARLAPDVRLLAIDSRAGKVTELDVALRIEKDVLATGIRVSDTLLVDELERVSKVVAPLHPLFDSCNASEDKVCAKIVICCAFEVDAIVSDARALDNVGVASSFHEAGVRLSLDEHVGLCEGVVGADLDDFVRV